MILTVTLNAAVDRTVAVPNFRLGHRHRAVESRTFAGGKGVNVARALKLLGRPAIATGLAGQATGSRILERLAEESILHDFTRIAGESRTNLAMIDPTSGEQSEINERGPEVQPEEIDLFIERLLYLAQGSSLCVLAGSVPPAVDPGRVRAADRRAAPPWRLGAPRHRRRAHAPRTARRARCGGAKPWTRPRRQSGHEFNDADDYALGLAGLLEMGAGEAVITREAGCVAIVRDGQRSPPLRGRDRAARAHLGRWLR